ncbi:MAG: hypothetical protein AAGI54_12575 [Planctomycetota bacterium]
MARKRRLVPFAITALVLVTLAVPTAYVAAPWVEMRLRLHQLDHPDEAVRRRAIAYAARHVTDPWRGQAVRSRVWETMAKAGPERFEAYRAALESVGQWRVGRVEPGVWLTWVRRLQRSSDPMTRVEAVWLTADLPEGEQFDEAKRGLLLLTVSIRRDDDDDVQVNAVAAAAELSGAGGELGEESRADLALVAEGGGDAVVGAPAREAAGRLINAIDASRSGPAVTVADVLPSVTEGELLAGLSSEDPGLQALALTCLRAGVTPIEEDEQAMLAAVLLRSFDPVERRAGALLAGATGTHGELLAERLASAGDYTEASMLRLSLWLQGGGEAGWDPALLLVTPQVLPMPLVRWGLVVPTLMAEPAQRSAERRRVAAVTLDDWLVPRGDLPHGLVKELSYKHGWQAMAPLTAWVGPVPADADADVQELMAERLRDHWLVTRRRFLGDSDTTGASR